MTKPISTFIRQLSLTSTLFLAGSLSAFAVSPPQKDVTADKPITETTIKTATQPKIFNASYSTRYSGFNAKGTRSLSKKGNEWTLEFGADASVVSLTEASRFTVENGKVKPQFYRYKRGGLFGSKPEEARFDWKTMEATWNTENAPVKFPKGAQDKLSYQFQLGMDLAAGKTDLNYPIVDDDKIYQREFIIEGDEVLKTSAGPLNTVRVKRKRDNNKRQTWIWFAKDWDYVLVKLHQKDDSEYLIEFSEGEVNGIPITGLSKHPKS